MGMPAQKGGRNLSMECCKMVAAIFAVFIHAEFPGTVGSLVVSFARFAVPVFFAISGYFNYQATESQILRRLWHILKLNIGAMILYVLWTCFIAAPESLGAAVALAAPDAASLVQWMLLHASPYALAEPLWFLTALAVVYGILWGYVSFFGRKEADYRPLYGAGFVLFATYFTLVILLPAGGMEIPYRSYRNGWLLGVPMFLMGMFLRQYETQIRENLRLTRRKLAGLIVLGSGLVLLQWKAESMGEMSVGTLISVTALMLLMSAYPVTFSRWPRLRNLVSSFGVISTAVYILHPVLVNVYDLYFHTAAVAALGEMEPWFRPLAVLAMSLVAAALWERGDHLLKSVKRDKER